jgi:glutamate synthase domain-containing protein 2
MDPNKQCAMMASQATAMVLVMVCFVVTRLKRNNGQTELITYDPRTEGEQHRQRTLQMIYNINDECLAMLHMIRALFSLCNLFRNRGLVPETTGCFVEEQVAMFLQVVGHNQRFRVVH